MGCARRYSGTLRGDSCHEKLQCSGRSNGADVAETRRTLADLMRWHAQGGFIPDLGLALLCLADADAGD